MLEKAAVYLGIPTLFVLIHADVVQLSDFLWPGKRTVDDLIAEEIRRLREDKIVGPFVPVELDNAGRDLRILVAYLFREKERNSMAEANRVDWLAEMRTAVMTHLADPPRDSNSR